MALPQNFFINCQNPEWKLDKQARIPYAKVLSVYGWQLP
jgi:hypothetical protein